MANKFHEKQQLVSDYNYFLNINFLKIATFSQLLDERNSFIYCHMPKGKFTFRSAIIDWFNFWVRQIINDANFRTFELNELSNASGLS